MIVWIRVPQGLFLAVASLASRLSCPDVSAARSCTEFLLFLVSAKGFWSRLKEIPAQPLTRNWCSRGLDAEALYKYCLQPSLVLARLCLVNPRTFVCGLFKGCLSRLPLDYLRLIVIKPSDPHTVFLGFRCRSALQILPPAVQPLFFDLTRHLHSSCVSLTNRPLPSWPLCWPYQS